MKVYAVIILATEDVEDIQLFDSREEAQRYIDKLGYGGCELFERDVFASADDAPDLFAEWREARARSEARVSARPLYPFET